VLLVVPVGPDTIGSILRSICEDKGKLTWSWLFAEMGFGGLAHHESILAHKLFEACPLSLVSERLEHWKVVELTWQLLGVLQGVPWELGQTQSRFSRFRCHVTLFMKPSSLTSGLY